MTTQAESTRPVYSHGTHPVMVSKWLGKTQLRGARRCGDVIIPGDGKDFPAFSETGLIKHIDRMLDYMTEDDRDGLAMLFGLFAFLPKLVISLIMAMAKTKTNAKFPSFLGASLRQIYIGIRGMFFTLYYSNIGNDEGVGKKIMQNIKYDTQIIRHDEGALAMPETNVMSLENPDPEEITRIYSRARVAQKLLAKLSVSQRLKYVAALKDIILARKEHIIDRIQQDTKKSRSDALISEIFGTLDHLSFLDGQAVKALQDQKVKTPLALMGKKSRVLYDPLGTMLVISPWNYPFYQAIVPITISFVAGNSTLYKPSEITPLTGLVEELLEEAGFPKDTVQVIYGKGDTGSALIDARPDKIFFTGSVLTGKKIMAQASEQLIPVELELGGKDPMIVFEDADLERSVAGALWGGLTTLGQSCTSVERLYVHDSIYDDFKKLLLKRVGDIVQKVDTDGDADVGAMTSDLQVKVIKQQFDDAKSKGATILSGGDWDGENPLIPPIILEDITTDMLVAYEETFGPIIPLYRFYDEGEVIDRANDSEFGLSASVWTGDLKRADRVARALVTGNVSINNVMLTEGNHHLPFGGIKNSGMGRYKGVWGLHAFSNIKAILIDANKNNIEANWYPYTKAKYQLFSKMTEGLFKGGIGGLIKFALAGTKLESYANKAGKQGRK
jgi:acyl-CoA reductase-like NAD-dependent aldehyde dehydrogenase